MAQTSSHDHVVDHVRVFRDDASYRAGVGQFLDEMVSEIGQNMLTRGVVMVTGLIDEGKLQRNALEVGRLFRVNAACTKLGDLMKQLATGIIRKDREVSKIRPYLARYKRKRENISSQGRHLRSDTILGTDRCFVLSTP